MTYLWTPSPVNVAPEVGEAAQEPMCHREKRFGFVLEETKDVLCSMAGMERCAILNGNGSLAVTAAIQSFIGHGDTVFVWDTGNYSQRMLDAAINTDGEVSTGTIDSFNPEHLCDWFLYCHQETMTGQINIPPELPEGTKVLCDMVSTFGAYEMPRADVIATCGNKCLESICGSGIVMWKGVEPLDTVHPLSVGEYGIPCTLNVPAILGLNKALSIHPGVERRGYTYRARLCEIEYTLRGARDKRDSCNVFCYRCEEDVGKSIVSWLKNKGHIVYPWHDGMLRFCTMGYNLDTGSLMEAIREVLSER